MTRDLEGRRVLVVGANPGIGGDRLASVGLPGRMFVVASRGGAKLAAVARDIGAQAASLDMIDEAANAALSASEASFVIGRDFILHSYAYDARAERIGFHGNVIGGISPFGQRRHGSTTIEETAVRSR